MSKTPSRGADRTLALFEAFAEAGGPLPLSRLARLMKTPVSTCHGLVRTLEARGYLYTLGQSRRIYPTKRLLLVAERIARQDPIAEHVAPALARLRDRTGETVILGARQNDAVVYLDVLEGAHVIRYSARPGDIKPLHSSSIGKLMLGEMSREERAEILARAGLDKVTPNTIVEPVALETDLEAARDAGLYVTRGENVADVMAVAVPLVLSGNVFGIAVAGPIDRVGRNFPEISDALRDARSDIEGAA